MANWKAEPASGSEYDVFLNFRGKDTRYNFTDFLHKGLVDAGFRTFMDEEELPYGDVISHELEHAINNSMLYISIFSQNYASSKWCLRELKLIVDNVSASGGKKSILPIFFFVEPDDVKLKAQPDRVPLYKAAFEEHEKNYPEEYEAWKTALGKVGEHKGPVVEKKTRQAKIVELVVEEVLEKLKSRQQSVPERLVGLEDRVKRLIELLDVNHHEVRVIGIYGMAGIGKTTIAKVVFNHLSFHFGKYCIFLEDIRESSSTTKGIVELQKKLLSNIVGSGSVEQLMDSEDGMKMIQKTLSTKKVLVVLDDVDKKEHVKKLLGNSSLHSGSRIIITTKNRDVLQGEGFKCKIQPYEMLKMDDGPTLQLFYQHAFGGDFPLDDYDELSSEIVSRTGGLPLTVQVIGSSLKGKNKAYWKETSAKLENVPVEEILKKLKVSYDDLDRSQQQIFLDIACFFFNEEKTDAMFMWDECSFFPEIGIEALISKCLIKIFDNKFWMHSQLIALGRQIVRDESPNDLRKQSRLWINDEALQIMKIDQRKENVQALSIMIPEITNEDFERFPNLRLLELRKGTYVGDFAKCHSNLRWLSWHSSPEEDFGADNFSLDRLVVCKLYTVKYKDDSKALDLIKRARDLKVLYFTQCYSITTIPNISKCWGLARLALKGCSSLERIESFIGDLQSLIELKIEDCRNFMDLPKEVGKLVKLEHFSLSGCEKLIELPGSIGNLISLTELDLSDTIIRELPDFIRKLKSLRILRFTTKEDMEDHEWQLPSSISTLVNLEELDLSGHKEMKGKVPDGIGELSSLRILNLESTGIWGIPRTITMLRRLQTLNLSSCHEIQELPELPTNLTCLHLESKSLLSLPDLSNLTNLVELLLSNYRNLGEKSKALTGCDLKWIGRLSRLKKLKLNLVNVPAPPDLASLSHLEELSLSCLDLETVLPFSVRRLDFQFFSISSADILPSCLRLTNVSRLEFHHGEVEDVPLDGLPQLEKLSICSCERLRRLSIPMELMKLQEVSVSSCPELAEIQVVGLSKSLKSFCVSECKSLTRISGLQHLKNLKNLAILCCSILTVVEGLGMLESRPSSIIRECPLLIRARVSIEVCTIKKLSQVSCSSLPATKSRKKATAWWKKIRFWRTWKRAHGAEWLEEDSPVPRIWSGAEEEEEVDEDEDAEEDEEVAEDEDAEEEEDEYYEEEPPTEDFLQGRAEGEWLGDEEEEEEKEEEKVVVFKLDLHNEKDKKKAIKIVSGFAGVKSFSVDMEDMELTVIGDIDAVLLASKLREWFDTHLMSIEAAF